MRLEISSQTGEKKSRIVLLAGKEIPDRIGLTPQEHAYAGQSLANDQRIVRINRYDYWIFLVTPDPDSAGSDLLESIRLDGVAVLIQLNQLKVTEALLIDESRQSGWPVAFAEGVLLGSYQFLKYRKDASKKSNPFQKLIITPDLTLPVDELNILTDAVNKTRDLVNEPVNVLNAPKLADTIVTLGQKVGLITEVMDKNKIESLNMGGLLAVNRGSIDPPRFIVVEWKPERPVNDRPLVLVGKGVMYDTGGLSLKPTPNSMDEMKCDMAGAAAVTGTLYALSRMNWPVRAIGLIPATDNRPDGNAYTPGDVIRMHDGTTVEVLNTDAEGRLILADALSYAKRYKPGLVLDLATLTGAAQLCLGSEASAVMGTAEEKVFDTLIEAGYQVHERLVALPLWKEYLKLLDSDIADLKNIGGRMAGAITAGKFLEHFTDYPWIHIDIAGTAFLTKEAGYRPVGGTGVGVRLLIEFIRRFYKIKM